MSPQLLDHFQNPRNAGEVAGADIVVEVSNPVCGDILKLWLKTDGQHIEKAGFKCRGCVASMACGSALTEWLTGRTLAEARALTAVQIEQAVGGLVQASKHAAELAVDVVRKI
jgi:nitrogen fixation NifU-like protein